MLATVVAESQQAVPALHLATLARQTIGKQEWSGVCATCHGNLGQGGYGPAIASNPPLAQRAALEVILRNGVTGTHRRDAARRRHLDGGADRRARSRT